MGMKPSPFRRGFWPEKMAAGSSGENKIENGSASLESTAMGIKIRNRLFRTEFESCGPADNRDATTGALKSEHL